jgi:6-phosphogluconate dehydrogenase
MGEQKFEIGLIGLGEMGRNLALNIADHGIPIAVHNRTAEKIKDFMETDGAGRSIGAGYSLSEFIKLLRRPRAILLIISAGRPVDQTIQELLPLLEPNDLIIDGGNSLFSDTDRRERELTGKALLYLGLGISGGGLGARYGPSLMPGGAPQAYERVRPILEAIAAKVNGIPCVTYLGSGSAGHYVKMVHNGIEYGVMQLIAEAYHLLKQGLGLNNDDLSLIFDRWNQTELKAYLIEITARIFRQEDERNEGRLIDKILDQAGQKGTGMWTSVNALELQVPTPTIDLAVVMRDLSGCKQERQAISRLLGEDSLPYQGEREGFIAQLGEALYGGLMLTYGQGLTLLRKASRTYQYGLDLGEVVRIWSGGCIIRAFLLEKILAAYRVQPDLIHPLLDPDLAERMKPCQEALRTVIKGAVELGIPVPGLMASLAYYDSLRSPWLPANLIQAQRDYFGAHTYERVDGPGIFHTQWTTE